MCFVIVKHAGGNKHELSRSRHLREPRLILKRRCNERPARSFRNEVPPQGDDIREIEIKPSDSTVVYPVECRIHAAADVNDSSVGIAFQKFSHAAIDEQAPRHPGMPRNALHVAGNCREVEIYGLHDPDGRRIRKKRVGFTGFDGATPEGRKRVFCTSPRGIAIFSVMGRSEINDRSTRNVREGFSKVHRGGRIDRMN